MIHLKALNFDRMNRIYRMEKRNGIAKERYRLVMLPPSAFHPDHPVNPVSISAFLVFLLHRSR
jgi:hypothetical protein